MDRTSKFVLPSPNFGKPQAKMKLLPHFLTPSGMTLLPRERQPPPMYGPRGPTIPGKFLKQVEPMQQFCKVCKLELQSVDDMQRHMAQHQRCQFVNCTYHGHPKMMEKHLAMVHSSGLFNKCKRLSTLEEIASWRDERRKRFPTIANVEIRKRAQEQRLKRGERLETRKRLFGKREDRLKMKKAEKEQNKESYKDKFQQRKSNRKNNKNQIKKKSLQIVEKSTKSQEFLNIRWVPETEEISTFGVDVFRGTRQLENYKHLKAKTTTPEQNLLTSLLGMYGSDEEDGTDGDDTKKTIFKNEYSKDNKKYENKLNTFSEVLKPNSTKKDEVVQNHVNLLETSLSSVHSKTNDEAMTKDLVSDEQPEETAIAKSPSIPETIAHIKPLRQQTKSKNLMQKICLRKNFGLDYTKCRLRKQNTMLEKLLEGDIRHERNVLLQCVRFLCENNYLNVI